MSDYAIKTTSAHRFNKHIERVEQRNRRFARHTQESIDYNIPKLEENLDKIKDYNHKKAN